MISLITNYNYNKKKVSQRACQTEVMVFQSLLSMAIVHDLYQCEGEMSCLAVQFTFPHPILVLLRHFDHIANLIELIQTTVNISFPQSVFIIIIARFGKWIYNNNYCTSNYTQVCLGFPQIWIHKQHLKNRPSVSCQSHYRGPLEPGHHTKVHTAIIHVPIQLPKDRTQMSLYACNISFTILQFGSCYHRNAVLLW